MYEWRNHILVLRFKNKRYYRNVASFLKGEGQTAQNKFDMQKGTLTAWGGGGINNCGVGALYLKFQY